MPYTTTMDVSIGSLSSADAITLAKKFWSIYNGGFVDDNLAGHLSPSVLASPKYVVDGANSHFLFSYGTNPAEVSGAYATQAAMNSDLSPPAGTVVNCFDPETSKRGRYTKTGASGGGSWTIASATISDRAWSDYNHPQRLLELLICSYVSSAAPLPWFGPIGYTGPASGDWRGARLTLDIGCRDLQLGPWAKLGQHVQGNVPARAAALTARYGEGDKYFIPNFIQKRQLLSDALGFGRDSWGIPNDVPIVAANRVQHVVDFTTDDDDWVCFGDPGRSPVGRSVNYGVDKIANVLTNLKGNTYTLVHHDVPKDGSAWWTKSSDEHVSEFDRVRGDIMLYGIKIEAFTA